MNKLNSLTWKYFWEQKGKEINDWWEEERVEICIFSIICSVAVQLFWLAYVETNLIIFKVLPIIGLCILGFWILLGIIAIIKCISNWLENNWEKASKRAKKELKNVKYN